MSDITDNLKSLTIVTLRSPRTAARKVLDLEATRGQVWGAFIAMILLSVVLTGLGQILFPLPPEDVFAMFQLSPFGGAALLAIITLALTSAVVAIGRVFGGVGTLDGGLRLIAWMQAVLIALQAVQLVLLFLLPPVAVLIGLASIGIFGWLLLNFVAELHRFPGLGQAVIVVLLAFALASFVLLSLISSFGLIPPMEAPNV